MEDNKDKAKQGWIGEVPHQDYRTPPSHANKWYKIMDASYLLKKEGKNPKEDRD